MYNQRFDYELNGDLSVTITDNHKKETATFQGVIDRQYTEDEAIVIRSLLNRGDLGKAGFDWKYVGETD